MIKFIKTTSLNAFQKHKQFVLFLMIGGVNTVFGYSIFALLISFKLNYILAALVSTVAGIIFNFNTFGRVVFKNIHKNLFLKFLLVYAVAYIVNVGLLTLLDLFIHNFYMNGAISMLIVAFLSYTLNKNHVFKEKNEIN